jgi:Fe2+ or Zn2+ uptake regulation protein
LVPLKWWKGLAVLQACAGKTALRLHHSGSQYITLSEIGAATVVEGTGDAKRFDGDLDKHQHFRCVKCKRIVDFHYEPLDNLSIPVEIEGRFTVLRTTVYVEGLCDSCR